jgi:hypothetical protein
MADEAINRGSIVGVDHEYMLRAQRNQDALYAKYGYVRPGMRRQDLESAKSNGWNGNVDTYGGGTSSGTGTGTGSTGGQSDYDNLTKLLGTQNSNQKDLMAESSKYRSAETDQEYNWQSRLKKQDYEQEMGRAEQKFGFETRLKDQDYGWQSRLGKESYSYDLGRAEQQFGFETKIKDQDYGWRSKLQAQQSQENQAEDRNRADQSMRIAADNRGEANKLWRMAGNR